MLFALIFPRAQRASTYDISAERNVWLQSALRSFAIVCDYMETGLFAIVCDLRSAIVCDHMETSLKTFKVMHQGHHPCRFCQNKRKLELLHHRKMTREKNWLLCLAKTCDWQNHATVKLELRAVVIYASLLE